MMALSALKLTEPLGDQAYGSIRDAIISCLLEPGERVTERGLAANLGVSATPVREALCRLEQEGLLERRGMRGVYVAQMPLSALSELIHLQAVLRGEAARLAAHKLTGNQLHELQDLLQQAHEAAEAGSADAVYDLSQRFHESINLASGNDLLISFLNTINAFESSHRIRVLREELQAHSSELAQSQDEHAAIARALIARNPERAEALMRAHTLRAGESIGAKLMPQR
jgi:DNA-binding GntR family transcriptional regulator